MVNFYTPEEAAKTIGVHTNTVRTLLKNGKLPGYRKFDSPRGRISIPVDSVNTYKESLAESAS